MFLWSTIVRNFFRVPGNKGFFHFLFQKSSLISATDGAVRVFLPPYAAAWFEPTSVEVHQTGTSEGRSTDWATGPQLPQLQRYNEKKYNNWRDSNPRPLDRGESTITVPQLLLDWQCIHNQREILNQVKKTTKRSLSWLSFEKVGNSSSCQTNILLWWKIKTSVGTDRSGKHKKMETSRNWFWSKQRWLWEKSERCSQDPGKKMRVRRSWVRIPVPTKEFLFKNLLKTTCTAIF